MLTDEVIEVLNRLKKCSLSISIDGLNDTYEWIRGYSWDKFNLSFDNLLSKYNKNFLINHTTSVYNLDRISDIYSWISHECQSRYNHRIEFNLLQIAMTPMYQNPMYASTDRLSNAIDILNYVLEDPYDIWLYSHNMKSHVLVLKNYLEKCLYYKPTDMNEANNKLSKHHLSLVHKSHDLLCSIRGWDLQERVGYELFRK
jgi:hypothetical protein